MTEDEIKSILSSHLDWICDQDGKCANLRDANLMGVNLIDANLKGANLRGADLKGADLRSANLKSADLRNANLRDADLRDADLRSANLEDADLRGANLRDTNLIGTNLEGADLRNVNLEDAIGNMMHIKSIQVDKYQITYTFDVMQIGCKRYSINEWRCFTDEQIAKMDNGALEWWARWKPIIMKIIDISPCEPTIKSNEIKGKQ